MAKELDSKTSKKKKIKELFISFTPIICSIISLLIAYETVKTSQFSNINAVLVEKYKTDLTHLEECVTSIQKMDTEIDLKYKEIYLH